MKIKTIITTLFILFQFFAFNKPVCAQYQLSSSTFGGGGNTASDSIQYSIYSSFGGETIGTASNGEYVFSSGFWAGNVDVVTGIEFEDDINPYQYELFQNYPNPFNPSTTIKFSIPKATEVKLNIYNILGQQVARIFEKQMPAGIHVVNFDASKYASGMYFYTIETKDFHQVKKMVLVK